MFTTNIVNKFVIIFFIIFILLTLNSPALAQNNNIDDLPCCCEGVTGNIDGDEFGEINIIDLTRFVGYLFKGGDPLVCPGEGNINGDSLGEVNIVDLTSFIGYFFKSQSPPASCVEPIRPQHQLGDDGEIICDIDFGPPCNSLYILPFQVSKTYKVINSNCAPVGGHQNWFAYDFNTQMGDTIIASRAGIVIVSNDSYDDNDFTCGHENNVFIKHSDQTVIRYTHLLNGGNLVSVNDIVIQGQPIGLSGKSGCTGGVPHLHFAAFNNRFSYDRQNSICINFKNAYGWHTDNNALFAGQLYLAEEF